MAAVEGENLYRKFKLVLLGDTMVGKTAILISLFGGFVSSASPDYPRTVGVDFRGLTVELNGKKIRLMIWDTAGITRFRRSISSYVRDALGIMLVYDTGNEKSFDNIADWLEYCRENGVENVPKVLLAHRCRTFVQEIVSKERGESFAQENGMRFFEVCAETKLNIWTAFITMAEDILEKYPVPDLSPNIVDPTKNKIKEIPAEILVKGPDALKVYQAALKVGESDCNLVRLMVMGQENVGKTCLINSLLGKKFNKRYIITEVLAMTRSLMLDEADKTKWKEKEIDHKDEIKEKHENALATKAAEDLQKIEHLPSSKSTGLNVLGPNTDQQRKQSTDDVTADEETKQSTANTNTNTETYQATVSASQSQIEVIKIDDNVIEKIVQVLKGKSIKDNSLRIWDFGGQLIYHSIHRLYMTPESIFVIVFNLLDKLDDFAKVLDSSGKKHTYHMTNLEYLLYWIRSAYTYTKDKVFYTDPLINFPVFIIVGTHCYSLTGAEVKEKFDKIRKAIENQVFKSHVYKEYFAVENYRIFRSDENIVQLKKVILEMKEKMKRPIPLKWLDLLIAIQKLSEENVTLPLEQVKSMAKKYGILDDETIDVAITYLSDVGEIMYHPTEEALKDIVVIQPMEIVKYVRAVFTIKEPKQWEATLIDDWKKLEKGVLTKRLLKHLWEEFPIFRNDTDEKMFNFFVNLMKKFGLLCQKKKQNTDADGIVYYAISHLPPKQYSEDPNDDQGNNKISIFHDFHGFLPDYLFHLTITKFIEEFQVENGPEPTLAYEHAELNIDDHHYVRIAVATINHQRMFKTTIVKRQEPSASYVVEPVPETCKKVLSFLQLVLEGLCCARGIRYKMCIPCSCPAKCQRMHSVRNFNKHIVFCGDFVISIERYCRLFGAEVGHGTSSSEQITIQGMTDMQFNALKMDVSLWYDDHKCLTMLKVLFKDLVDNERLSKITKTLDLLNDLVAHGHLHVGNLAILHDTISITRHFGLLQKIKVKLPSFPDVKEGLISKQFSYHRQRIMKCGMTLTTDIVTQIDGLLNTPCKDYIDGWSMIIDLEDGQIISEKNMEVFIDILKRLAIYPALNALQDVL